MRSRLEIIPKRYFAGRRNEMSLVNNTTLELWKSFMPRKKEITSVKGEELYSIELYPHQYFKAFDPSASFEKWAAVEIHDKSLLPEGIEILTIPKGQYVVFTYKGSSSGVPQAYAFIFRQWLPASDFELDNRPHFAVMGEKYKNDSEDSEEELWIPIRIKDS